MYHDFTVWLTIEVQWRGNAVVAQCWCVIHSTIFGKFIHVIGRVYDRHWLLLRNEQLLLFILVLFVFLYVCLIFICLRNSIFVEKSLGHILYILCKPYYDFDKSKMLSLLIKYKYIQGVWRIAKPSLDIDKENHINVECQFGVLIIKQ